MMPLEAAKALAQTDPAIMTGWCPLCGHPHTQGCPWLAMPQIVAALEAAGALASGRGPETEMGECFYCDGVPSGHAPGCPWRALVAALKGEPAWTQPEP